MGVGVVLTMFLASPARAGGDAEIVTHGADPGIEVEATGYDPGANGEAAPASEGSSGGETASPDEAPVATSISLHNCLPVFGDTGVPVDSVVDSTGDCGAYSPEEDDDGSSAEEALDPARVASTLFDQMTRLAPAPAIETAPGRFGLSGLPSYFWLEPPPKPLWVRASVPGMLVEATATPESYLWRFGDGGELVTDGSGRRWRRGKPGDVDHVFEARGRYIVSITITWRATWRIGAGDWTSLGSFVTGSEHAHRVRQVLAILDRG